MRLIDADALKERIRKALGIKSFDNLLPSEKTIVKQIDMASTIQPDPHWIPVTERLPEVSGCYLVSVKNDHERRYSKTAWFEKGACFARQDVIAWMPLPEPYKGVTT